MRAEHLPTDAHGGPRRTGAGRTSPSVGRKPIRIGHRMDNRRIAAALVADLQPVVSQVRETAAPPRTARNSMWLNHVTARRRPWAATWTAWGPVWPRNQPVWSPYFRGRPQDRMWGRGARRASKRFRFGRRRPQVRAGELVGSASFPLLPYAVASVVGRPVNWGMFQQRGATAPWRVFDAHEIRLSPTGIPLSGDLVAPPRNRFVGLHGPARPCPRPRSVVSSGPKALSVTTIST